MHFFSPLSPPFAHSVEVNTEAELMPGLPEDIARECLIRVPFDSFSTIRSVCKLWKHDVLSPPFHTLRKSAGLVDPIVAVAQSEPLPAKAAGVKQSYLPSPLSYRLSIFNPATGAWSSAPMIPSRSHGLPLFCQMTVVGIELVVVGGWNSRTWAASNEVHIYNMTSGTWRRGAPMPGPRRSFFAVAGSEESRMVFVAGGHDESKNALRSALAYDVVADEWIQLPDMTRQRDECRGVFTRGAFHVLGGYPTEAQAQFTRSVETFDATDWRWRAVEEGKLAEAASPRTCVVGGDGKLYMCLHKGHVAVLQETENGSSTWRRIAELPVEIRAALQMVAWEGGLMVFGSGNHDGAQVAYILDLEGGLKWRKVEMLREFSGHVQAACCIEI